MGKNLIQQARGKGSPRYRSPGWRFAGSPKHPSLAAAKEGRVVDLVNCPGHSAPLAEIEYPDGSSALVLAPEGIRVGQRIASGADAPLEAGSVLPLREIPEGTLIYNLESKAGDGGKFCRAGGTAARVVSKTEREAVVLLPSKKERTFNLDCRAAIGIIAGGGRTEKPILKAGAAAHAARARNKRYPIIGAAAQNAVDHPYGNKRTSRKAKQRPTSRFAPPGRKVGKLWPKRTGKKK